MEQAIRKLVDTSTSPAAMQARADMVLERARWAAQVFQRYGRDHTNRIAEAVARVALNLDGAEKPWR